MTTVLPSLHPPLRRLRWAMAILLAAALPCTEKLLSLPVSYAAAASAIGALVVLNLVSSTWLRSADERVLAVFVGLDMVAITVVLAASGGPANPFSALLLAYVALAAFLFARRVTFALTAFATCTFGALFLLPQTPSCHASRDPAFSNHLYGMWIAFVLVAVLVASLVTQVRRVLRAREQEILRLRQETEQAHRFAALGTLAAGTAHELGTPLTTIQVLAAEMTGLTSASPDIRDNASSILSQVDRCRDVIRRMDPGARGEQNGESQLGRTVRAAVTDWLRAHPSVRVIVEEKGDSKVGMPQKDVAAALAVLLDNAAYATRQAEAPIVVRTATGESGPYLEVEDQGEGFDPALEGRVGEPFVSTKAPGEGMGLGLYLVRKLLQEVGGSLAVFPRAPKGSIVRLEFAWLPEHRMQAFGHGGTS